MSHASGFPLDSIAPAVSRLTDLFSTAMSPAKARRVAGDVAGRYGSFADAVAAPLWELEPAFGETAAKLLYAVHTASIALRGDRLRNVDLLDRWDKVVDYLKVTMGRLRAEQFRVLFLDQNNRLIADEVMHEGTVNQCPAYPREIARRALILDATAVILVHNHPSGNPMPSQADIGLTREVIAALKPLGITVHDHLIVGDGEPTSLKGQGCI